MPSQAPNCPDCGQPVLRHLGGNLLHCERCRYTVPWAGVAAAGSN